MSTRLDNDQQQRVPQRYYETSGKLFDLTVAKKKRSRNNLMLFRLYNTCSIRAHEALCICVSPRLGEKSMMPCMLLFDGSTL